jgi:hypothetical protein
MTMRTHPVLALTLALALSGCLSSGSSQGVDRDAFIQPPAEDPQAGTDTGSIQGSVTDDEVMPIRHATITLSPTAAETRSDQDGRFTFNDLAPGRYTLRAQRAGYTNATLDVNVIAAQITPATLIIEQLPDIIASKPRMYSIDHAAQFHRAVLHPTLEAYQPGTVNSCTGCIWIARAQEKPTNILIEVFGQHAYTNPTGNQELVIVDAWIDDAVNGSLHITQTIPLPGAWRIEENFAQRASAFQVTLRCETDWFCLEESREVWVTFSHKMKIPAEFSAKASP